MFSTHFTNSSLDTRHQGSGEKVSKLSTSDTNKQAGNSGGIKDKDETSYEKQTIKDKSNRDRVTTLQVQEVISGNAKATVTPAETECVSKQKSHRYNSNTEFTSRNIGRQKRVLLLQGPIGPFFKNLQFTLEEAGYLTKRILFHKADRLFAPKDNTFSFRGDLAAWEHWLRLEIRLKIPDVIVLFGSSRPAHVTARRLALEYGITIISLEEGYLRTGYITCEIGGNNNHSPLAHWKLNEACETPIAPLKMAYSFGMMCIWGGLFYIWRELTKQSGEQHLYHRHTNGAFYEAFSWTSHMMRRCVARVVEIRSLYHLKKHRKNGFIFVPLQTPADAQIRYASKGWNNEKLVIDCLKSLKETDSVEELVFKTHPLDVTSHSFKTKIYSEAKRLGVAHKVHVLHSGKVSELTNHCSGMIVINSTSAFSALHHNVPLLVLGDAIYKHPSIATTGQDESDIAKFFKCRIARDPSKVAMFVNSVRSNALIPGDFYALSLQSVTAQNVVSSISDQIARKTNIQNTI